MNRLSPCKRREFLKKLRALGFEGPHAGTRHQFMLFQTYRLTVPTNKEYSVPQLKMMLKEVEGILERELSVEEWNEL